MPDIWYQQGGSAFEKAMAELSELAQTFILDERVKKEERGLKRREASIESYQKLTGYSIDPYEFGDPYEDYGDYQKYMAQVQDYKRTADEALNYTQRGGTVSSVGTKTVSAGIDATPYHFTKEDVNTFESYLMGGDNLSASVYWSGLVNMEEIEGDDARDLVEKGLLLPTEIANWNNPQVRNQVKKRWKQWKSVFISQNDVYNTDDEFRDIVTSWENKENQKVSDLESDPEYELAESKVSGYSQDYYTKFFSSTTENGKTTITGYIGPNGKEYGSLSAMPDGFVKEIHTLAPTNLMDLQQMADARGGYGSPGYQQWFAAIQAEHPEMAAFVHGHLSNYNVNVVGKRRSIAMGDTLGRDKGTGALKRIDWTRDMELLIDEQEIINTDLQPYVTSYVDVMLTLYAQFPDYQTNPQSKKMVIEASNKWKQQVLAKIQNEYDQGAQARPVRSVYISQMGGIEEIFNQLLRNKLRSGIR